MKYNHINSNLDGESYLQLLNLALERSKYFSLVWRDSFKFESSAHEIEDKLKPYLIKEELTNEWPGTKITVGPPETTIRFYRTSKESIDILKRSNSVYEWLAPDYPEDLAFYDIDNDPWFGSVTHEEMAFFIGDKLSLKAVQEKIPGIDISIDKKQLESTAE